MGWPEAVAVGLGCIAATSPVLAYFIRDIIRLFAAERDRTSDLRFTHIEEDIDELKVGQRDSFERIHQRLDEICTNTCHPTPKLRGNHGQ